MIDTTKKNKRRKHVVIAGSELRRLRKASYMTTTKLAEAIDITNPSITRYEKDQYSPNIDVLIPMLEVLNKKVISTNEKYFEIQGTELQRLRNLRELTTKDLAKSTNLTESFIINFESAQTKIDLEILIRILKSLKF